MWLNRMMRRPRLLIIYLGIIIVLVLVISAIVRATSPSVEISVTGDHNPTNQTTTVNDNRVYPLGKDGKIYQSKLKIGSNTIQLRGAFIEDSSVEIDAGYFEGKKQAELVVTAKKPETIVREYLKSQDVVVSISRTFEDSQLIVAYADNAPKNEYNETSYAVILHYNRVNFSWDDIYKTYYVNRESYDLGPVVEEYIQEFLSE